MAKQLRIEKVTALPATASRTPSTMYLVKASGATEVEIWITDSTGSPPAITRVSQDFANYIPRLEARRASFRMADNLVSYNGFGAITGAIAFLAPANMSYCMMMNDFSGFRYEGIENIIDFSFSGYWYSLTKNWLYSRIVHKGDYRPLVRVATRTSDGRGAIIIGEVSTVWNYPMIAMVKSLMSNDGANDDNLKGWTTEIITNMSVFGSSVAACIDGDNQAAKFKTPRKIALSGEVSGEVMFDGTTDVTIAATTTFPRKVTYGTPTISNILPTSAKVNWSIRNLNGYHPVGIRFVLYISNITDGVAETKVMSFPYSADNVYGYTFSNLIAGKTYQVRLEATDVYSPDNAEANVVLGPVQFITSTITADADSEILLVGNIMSGSTVQNLSAPVRYYKTYVGAVDTEVATCTAYAQQAGQGDWKKHEIIAEIEAKPLPVSYVDNASARIVLSPNNPIKVGDRLLLRKGDDVEVTTALSVTAIDTGKHRDTPWHYAAADYESREWNNGQDWNDTALLLTTPRYDSTCFKLGNYVFVAGGWNGTTPTATIDRISLNSDGVPYAVERNPTTANLPKALYGLISWVVGEYVYVAGGTDGTTWQIAVYRSKLDANGYLTPWTTNLTGLSTAVSNAGCVIYKGSIYVVGGKTAAAAWTANIQVAKVNADGSIGRFISPANGWPVAASGVEMFVCGDRIFGIGGNTSATAAVGSIYFSELLDNGELKPWAATPITGPQSSGDIRVLVLGPDLLFFAGYTGTTANSVTRYGVYTERDGYAGIASSPAIATHTYAGAHLVLTGSVLLAISNYSATGNKIAIRAMEVPIYPDSRIIEQNIVFDKPVNFTAEKIYRDDRKFAYVFDSDKSLVSGSFGPWWYNNPTAQLSAYACGAPVAFTPVHVAVRDCLFAINNYVFSIGGILIADGVVSNAVRIAYINEYGVLGAWSTSATVCPVPIYDMVPIGSSTSMHFVGGIIAGFRTNRIYGVSLSTGGSVSAITYKGFTPVAVNQHDMVAHGRYIYLIGGEADLETGSLMGPLPMTNATNATFGAAVRRITLRGKGANGTSSAPGAPTTVTYNGLTYTFPGGAINSAAVTTTITISVHPYISLFMTPTIPAGGSVTYEYYETTSGMNTDIYRTTLNYDGVMGTTWTKVGSLPTEGRAGFKAIVNDDMIYIVGGYYVSNGTTYFPDTVIAASITEAAGVGTWSVLSNFSWNVGAGYAMVRGGTKAYLVGGWNGSNQIVNPRTIDVSDSVVKAWYGGPTSHTAGSVSHLHAVVTRYAATFIGGCGFLSTTQFNTLQSIRYFTTHWKHSQVSHTMNRSAATYVSPTSYKFRDNTLVISSGILDASGRYVMAGMKLKAYDALSSLNVKLWN